MIRIRAIIPISFVLMIIALSCYNPQVAEVEQSPSYKYDFSSIYNPSETSLHPQVRIFVKNDNEATVFFKLSVEEIKANMQSQTDTSFRLVVKYALRDVSTFEIVDTGLNVFEINSGYKSKFIGSGFNIKLTEGSQNKLIVGFTGPKAYSGSRMIFDIDNSSDFSKDRFMLERESNGFELVFDNFVEEEKTYKISSGTFDKYSFNVSLYSTDDYIVIPPYYLADTEEVLPEPDSVFTYTIGDTIRFDSTGFYVFRASANSEGVFCLLNAGSSFPEIEILSDMYEPLKLVATNRELNDIKESDNLKTAIDNFWLSKSNNHKFAREQIRVFYTRVELANKYFSDYREGWKTDRGIIYVLLGPPTIVNMSSGGEEWFYGENPDVAGVLFIFDKGKSITGHPIYRLRRDAMYQTIWGQAITTWRNGRIFTITKN